MQDGWAFLYEIGGLMYEMDRMEIIGPIHWRGKTLMVNYMTINGEPMPYNYLFGQYHIVEKTL